MNDHRKPGRRQDPHDPGVLMALGFGPETHLMNDPKLFIDGRFLGALHQELESELGREGATAALFQIGASHGFRNAHRILEGEFLGDPTAKPGPLRTEPTLLTMQLSPAAASAHGSPRLCGSWPEAHEAAARVARAGRSDAPICFLSAGYTSGWLSAMHERDIVVVEATCEAAGDEQCTFYAYEPGSSCEAPHPREASAVRSLDQIRTTARQGCASGERAQGAREDCFERDERAVHIWGPVMILPFADADESLATVEMMSRDPATPDIRVVVVDLRNRLLDEGFEAAALEQLLERVESWGAEAILTGVSPFSEAMVAELEATHLLTRKDLSEAIATAFQIADAQRHLL